ncbi:MAG: phospho-sugar mutase [Firmicutes bacterium]|nr:phospho-sugar mutase [Bacillota bacterium]
MDDGYRAWLDDERVDPELREELRTLERMGQTEELADRFAAHLAFGTGGLRAKLGAGTNRMNVHTVRKASAGVVRWLCAQPPSVPRRIVIAYDGRHKSAQFAMDCARVAAAYNVEAFVFPEARPTPLLSYAVRYLQCGAGVMVTASHNPADYNGYKVYGADGAQVLAKAAMAIVDEMERAGDLLDIPLQEEQEARAKGLLQTVAPIVEASYMDELTVLHRALHAGEKEALSIVYTPLHGTGGALVPQALKRAGFTHVHIVAEQATLDAEFTHVRSPNPEEKAAYDLALDTARRLAEDPTVGAPDILLATDPDADRVGVMARRFDGTYMPLSGNEVGALVLADYLADLKNRALLPDNATVVTTHVTSDFGEAVARSFGVDTERTLTGFKFIGEKIAQYEASGKRAFVFGYEESVGYLAKPFVRDKDSVQAVLLIAQMAAALKAQGSDLPTALQRLFDQFGFYFDRQLSFTFEGQSGIEQMRALMTDLRQQALEVEHLSLMAVEDAWAGITRFADGRETALTLPQSDVLKFLYTGGAWIAVRPSGTEPKLKAYLGVCEPSEQAAMQRLDQLQHAFKKRANL